MPESVRTFFSLFFSGWPGTGDPPIMPAGLLPPPLTPAEEADVLKAVKAALELIHPGTTVIVPGGLDPNGPQG